MQAGQFLDDVDFALDIKPPAWNVHQVSVFAAWKHRETKTSQNTADFEGTDLFAENAVDLTRIELHGGEIELAGDHID